MVPVLWFAHDHDCESRLAHELLQQNPLPELKTLQKRFIQHHVAQPDIPSRQHTIDAHDRLLNGNWMTQEMARPLVVTFLQVYPDAPHPSESTVVQEITRVS